MNNNFNDNPIHIEVLKYDLSDNVFYINKTYIIVGNVSDTIKNAIEKKKTPY